MKLLLKFNLVFVLVFLLGLGVTGVMTRQMLERNAQEEVLQHARFLLEKALAVRAYTSTQMAPLLETQMKYAFLPQSVPAFSATEVLAKLQKNHPEYSYKEATLNPTNPRDRAVDWEADVIGEFRKAPDTQGVRRRARHAGRPRAVHRAADQDRRRAPACAATARVDAAPRTLVDKYGPANGFGWQLDEVVGAQMVSVPMAVPLERAARGLGAVHGHAVGGVRGHRAWR